MVHPERSARAFARNRRERAPLGSVIHAAFAESDPTLVREIKRRTSVIQVFPPKKSLIRLLGAAPSKTDEEQASRHWFAEESIAEVFEDRSRWEPGRPSAYESIVAEHAAHIIGVVMADESAVRKTT